MNADGLRLGCLNRPTWACERVEEKRKAREALAFEPWLTSPNENKGKGENGWEGLYWTDGPQTSPNGEERVREVRGWDSGFYLLAGWGSAQVRAAAGPSG